jgi:hypothetical protein
MLVGNPREMTPNLRLIPTMEWPNRPDWFGLCFRARGDEIILQRFNTNESE